MVCLVFEKNMGETGCRRQKVCSSICVVLYDSTTSREEESVSVCFVVDSECFFRSSLLKNQN